jgi:hypothetical protein
MTLTDSGEAGKSSSVLLSFVGELGMELLVTIRQGQMSEEFRDRIARARARASWGSYVENVLLKCATTLQYFQ